MTRSIFKRKKLNVFLGFVLLALIFSILTKLSKDYTQSLTLSIQPINIPEDKIIVLDSTHKLDVTITTYGFKFIRYFINPPKVNIDMTNLDRNESFFIWTEKKEFSNIVAQFDPNVKIENIQPDTLKFRYDSNAVKLIPVVLDAKIGFSAGHDMVDDVIIVPDSVRLIGPGILIDSITEVYTKTLTVENVQSDLMQSIALEAFENPQLRLSETEVTVSAKVDKFTEGSVDVPVIVKNIPEGQAYSIYPKIIKVFYYASLAAFNDITSQGFIVECDYKESTGSGLNYLVPKLVETPKAVKSARLNINRIEFVLE